MNSEFGMTVQKIICDKYNLKVNSRAKNQFESSYNEKYSNIESVIVKIFDELKAIPVKCLTFENDNNMGNTLSPHNFYLSNNMTLSIKTTHSKKNARVAPPVVGQAGFEKLNYHFGHLCDKKIENKNDIKELVWDKFDLMLPIFLDYLFYSDILVWIYIENNSYKYEIIYRNEKPDLSWDKSKLTFTKKSIEMWNESLTIKYDNISFAEVQVHKKRTFKCRFNLYALINLLKSRESNNETLGISLEYAICEIYHLEYPEHLKNRANLKIVKEVSDVIHKAFTEIPEPIKYVGAEKGEHSKQSKSPYDFILKGQKTLSLKTNIGNKVCPPEIGQPSIETFKNHFSYLIDDLANFDQYAFKKLVFDSIDILMDNYLKYLFDCDYLLWIYKNKNIYEYKALSYDINYKFIKSNFTFTKDLSNWNESNTVKYNGITIGEFQVHHNRNSLKFRFNMKNLLELLNIDK